MPEGTYVDQTGKVIQPVIVGSAVDTPVPYFEQISDVPSSMKVVVKPAKLRLTEKSDSIEVRKYGTIATYFLNVPFTDGLLTVSRIFKTLDVLSFNYERTHTDAFWQQYPNAMILREHGEEGYEDDTGWCRTHRRELCKRFAHYAYHYLESRKLLSASLINLNVLARVSGNDVLSNIASDCRWSYINTRCKLQDRFPTPKGFEDTMIKAASIALGKTSYGSTVYAFPQYSVDVLGNRGMTVQSITSRLHDDRDNTTNPTYADESVTSKYYSAEFLDDVIDWTLHAYCHNEVANDATDAASFHSISRAPKPTSLRYENGATLASIITASESQFNDEFVNPRYSSYSRLNCNNHGYVRDFYGTNHSHLTRDAWNAFHFWLEYNIRFFSKMMDPGSDFRILCSELNLIQDASSLVNINKAVLAVPDSDLNDLAAHMQYKTKCKVTTTTTVKYSPLFYYQNDIIDEDHPINLADDLQFDIRSNQPPVGVRYSHIFPTLEIFDMNFNRYPVDSYNTADIIKKSHLYPKLTPTFFYHDDDNNLPSEGESPIMINGMPEVGDIFLQAGSSVRGISPTGKYASYLDYTLAYSHNPDETKLSFQGISQKLAEDFANTRDDNIVIFDECPNNFNALVQPLLDPTDLYQCGFAIMVSDREEFKSEWTYFLTNPKAYTGQIQSITDVTQDPTNALPLAPVYHGRRAENPGGTTPFRMHVVNPCYLAEVGKAFVFVGVGLFAHPASLLAFKAADYYPTVFDKACGTDAVDFCQKTAMYRSGMLSRAGLFGYETGDAIPLDQHSSISATLALMGNDEDGEHSYDRLYTFSPDYPPVLIAHEYNSAIEVGSFPFAAEFNDLIYNRSSLPLSDAKSENKFFPRFDQSATEGEAASTVNGKASPCIATQRRFFIDLRYSSMMDLMFFLKSIVYSVPYVMADGMIIDVPGASVAQFASNKQWQFSLTAQIDIMYPGLRDTVPFWSRLDNIDCNPVDKIASAPAIPRNDAMMPPRTLLAGKRAQQPYSNQRNGARPSDSSVNSGSFAHEGKTNKSIRHRNRRGIRREATDEQSFVNSTQANTKHVDAFIREDKVNAGKDSPTGLDDKDANEFKKRSDDSPNVGNTTQNLV